ncbi:hypothetical protein OBBRIDRAFT_698074, partial [Obba rivulosa]
RFAAYEVGISLFLRHNCPLDAAMAYGYMAREGFIPSTSLRVQLHLIHIAQNHPSPDEVLKALSEAFAMESFDEHCLQDLLRLLSYSLQCSAAFVDQVAALFYATRGPGFTFSTKTVDIMVRIHARAGKPTTAKRWADEFLKRALRLDNSESKRGAIHPYTTLLRDLAIYDKRNMEVYRGLVEQLKAEGVVPDLVMYNALIAGEVTGGRYSRALYIYFSLMTHRSRHMTPDAHTFGSIFRALRRMHSLHPDRVRKYRHWRLILSPWMAFRQLLECHELRTAGRRSTPSPVIDVSVLNSALKMFMTVRDYAAAFVVVNVFQKCGLRADLSTYRIVVAALLDRIKEELPKIEASMEKESYWSYRFLGLEALPHPFKISFDAILFDVVLRYGREEQVSLRFVAPVADPLMSSREAADEQLAGTRKPNRKATSMPSLAQFIELEKPPPDAAWDTKALERILRRAILATRPHIALSPQAEVAIEIKAA